jgi:hypothetical protein
MELLDEFLSWAWSRHHNPLGWYIRPLFLLPFCYFAYKRSIWGIALTLLALATSMFWFPEPERPDPRAVEFLAMEKEYLMSDWIPVKVLLGLLVPISLAALALAFWKRSLLYGLVLIDAIMLTKVGWSFYYGGGSGLTLLSPAVVGLVACNAVVLYVAYRVRGKLSL